MFLDSLTGSHRKELETKCEELSVSLKNKQLELDRKELQLQRLSTNLRKWTRKYNELELSISENVIEASTIDADEHDEETRQLQLKLLKLNRRNARLEKRLSKMESLLNDGKTASSTIATPAETSQSRSLLTPLDEDFEPEFSPEFKEKLSHLSEVAAHD